jgi:hypothetical protein
MARDVALRDLDQAGFRVSNLGNPNAAGDATKTDNATVPKANAGEGSPGASFLAAPADHVHPTDPSAGGGGVIVSVDDPSYQIVTGVGEEVVFETFVDLTPLPAGEMKVALAAVVKVSAGNGLFSVRLGGTPGQADGNVVATLVTASAAFLGGEVTVFHVANPGNQQLLKLTGRADSAAGIAHIYGKSIQLRPQTGV